MNTKLYNESEDIVLEMERELNPINLKTGEKYVPSENEYVNAVERATQNIICLVNKYLSEHDIDPIV